jgi:hypothetical protein
MKGRFITGQKGPGRHTGNLIVDLHQIEGLAANGATVGLCTPFAKTFIVQEVIARFDLCHRQTVVLVARLGG